MKRVHEPQGCTGRGGGGGHSHQKVLGGRSYLGGQRQHASCSLTVASTAWRFSGQAAVTTAPHQGHPEGATVCILQEGSADVQRHIGHTLCEGGRRNKGRGAWEGRLSLPQPLYSLQAGFIGHGEEDTGLRVRDQSWAFCPLAPPWRWGAEWVTRGG